MTAKEVETLLDGETFGGWNGSALPSWVRSHLAPLAAKYRAKVLAELLASLLSAAPPPKPSGGAGAIHRRRP